MSHPTYSHAFNWKLTRMKRTAINRSVPLPSGQSFFNNAVLHSMDVLAKHFPLISHAIHSTEAPFTEQNNMYTADVCTSNAEDYDHWEFVARLMEKDVLGRN